MPESDIICLKDTYTSYIHDYLTVDTVLFERNTADTVLSERNT